MKKKSKKKGKEKEKQKSVEELVAAPLSHGREVFVTVLHVDLLWGYAVVAVKKSASDDSADRDTLSRASPLRGKKQKKRSSSKGSRDEEGASDASDVDGALIGFLMLTDYSCPTRALEAFTASTLETTGDDDDDHDDDDAAADDDDHNESRRRR